MQSYSILSFFFLFLVFCLILVPTAAATPDSLISGREPLQLYMQNHEDLLSVDRVVVNPTGLFPDDLLYVYSKYSDEPDLYIHNITDTTYEVWFVYTPNYPSNKSSYISSSTRLYYNNRFITLNPSGNYNGDYSWPGSFKYAATINYPTTSLTLKPLSPSASFSGEESYAYVTQWGTYGTGNGQFKNPAGILVDKTDNVYVADHYNSRIQKFSSTGSYITQIGSGTYGSRIGQMQNPWGVAEDPSGNIYVTDSGNNARVQKYSSGGSFITQWGTPGTGDGQFSFPTGVASDSAGNVYIAGYYNQRIQKFSPYGSLLTSWGTPGTGDGQFNHPAGVAIDASDNVYVADYGNNRIQKFSSTGTFITQWGTDGTGEGQFKGPAGEGVDLSGNVYIADTENHRIQKFSSDGTYITQWGTYGTGNGQFRRPHAVGVDSSGNVYVTDFENNRVQVFRIETSAPAGTGGVLENQTSGVIVTKVISPFSIKQGTDATITITINNMGPGTVLNLEVLDETTPGFILVGGTNQYTTASLEPDEIRLITYTVRAEKAGSYLLNRTAVMYAGEDGNYHMSYSGRERVEVLPSLIPPESGQEKTGNIFREFLAWLNEVFRSRS